MTHVESNNDYQRVAIEQLRKEVAKLQEKLKECEDIKIKLEQENERLNFQRQMAEADLGETFLDILQAKMATKKSVTKKIERFST